MSEGKLLGVRAPHFKNTASVAPQRIPVPATVTIPMVMHIGAPAKPVVKPGDEVKVGQLIAEAGGFVSSPIYASVSGKVKKIDDILASSGKFMQAIVIESDGEQAVYEGVKAPEVKDFDSFIAAVRESGVVGLGGAGFPTAVKLAVKDLSKIKHIVINGAECEPYVTSDTRTMIDDVDAVMEGIELLRKYLEAKHIVIGIEKNKPQCIKNFENRIKGMDGVEVKALPSMYPQGGEKVLIYNTTGAVVPEGGLPIDAGAIVINCTTLAAIAKYIKTGMPLVEKCVTVDGSAVKEPKNVIAPIGTALSELFAFCGGFKTEPKKILYGGPMMGIAVPDTDVPVLKNTNAILAFNEKDSRLPETTACIKCGNCINHCPLHLMPADIETAFTLKKADVLAKLKVNICMECGCCAYICPARRPLTQTNKLAKVMLRDWQAAQKAEQEKKAAKEAAKEKEAASK